MTQKMPASGWMAKIVSKPVLGVLLVVALVVTIFAPLNLASGSAKQYARTLSTTAAAVYVTLRGMNAVLSTAQEVELSGQFIVGGSAQPLKGLEPIDGTVERIAQVVFAVMVISAVFVVAARPIGVVGSGMAVVGLILLIWRGSDAAIRVGRVLTLYGAVLAIILPLGFSLSGVLADYMTAQVWDENQKSSAKSLHPIQIQNLKRILIPKLAFGNPLSTARAMLHQHLTGIAKSHLRSTIRPAR